MVYYIHLCQNAENNRKIKGNCHDGLSRNNDGNMIGNIPSDLGQTTKDLGQSLVLWIILGMCADVAPEF